MPTPPAWTATPRLLTLTGPHLDNILRRRGALQRGRDPFDQQIAADYDALLRELAARDHAVAARCRLAGVEV